VTAQDVAAQQREALLLAWDDVVEPFLTAAYERGRADGAVAGRAQVAAAVEKVLNPDGHPNARDYGRAAVWADDVRAAIAPHADALAEHDAEVLRAAADEFANGHQADKPRLREAVPQWLRARADRIEATS